MINFLQTTGDLANTFGFIVFSAAVAFAWAPFLIALLYRYHIEKKPKQELAIIEGRQNRKQVPEMGGLLVIVTVAVLTYLFDWSRSYTWVPIGVMLLSAFLGGIDDIMNIYGQRAAFAQDRASRHPYPRAQRDPHAHMVSADTAVDCLQTPIGMARLEARQRRARPREADPAIHRWRSHRLVDICQARTGMGLFLRAIRTVPLSRRMDHSRRHIHRHVHG